MEFRYHFDRGINRGIWLLHSRRSGAFEKQGKECVRQFSFCDLGYKSKKGKWKIVGRYTVFNTPVLILEYTPMKMMYSMRSAYLLCMVKDFAPTWCLQQSLLDVLLYGQRSLLRKMNENLP